LAERASSYDFYQRADLKNMRGVLALDGLNLEVNAGELLGFIDPNFAGKTITIKLLVGILKSYSENI
jgi:ABC-type multidrug transport system ATPase subunit